jgi:hypothetical protein
MARVLAACLVCLALMQCLVVAGHLVAVAVRET